MTTFLNNNSNVLARASYAAGIACGATVGYTLSASGDLLNNVLITTSCGVARAASHVIFHNPLTKQLVINNNERATANNEQKVLEKVLEQGALLKKMNILHMLYKASLGFSHGIALGTVGASEILTGTLNGALVYTLGFYAEVLPALALNKQPHIELFDERGKQIN